MVFTSARWSYVLGVGAALLLIGPGDALAQARGGGGGRGGGGTPLTPITYRQQTMQMAQTSMGALTAIRGGTVGAPSHVLARALILQQMGLMLPDLFPAGSVAAESRALPAIWENPSGFAERIAAFRSSADALVDAARGGNAEQIASAQMALQMTCGGCHMTFRGPAP